MIVDKQTLRELAKNATPGPWRTTSGYEGNQAGRHDDDVSVIEDARGSSVIEHVYYDGHHTIVRPRDVAFMVAANPQTVIALLDEIETLRDHTTFLRAHDEKIDAAVDKAYELATNVNAGLHGQLAAMTTARDALYDLLVDHAHYDSPSQAARVIAQAGELRGVGGGLETEVDDIKSVVSTEAPRGKEAEELRAGLEKIMADPPGGDAESNREWLHPLQQLLDQVDARDSLVHLESRDKIIGLEIEQLKRQVTEAREICRVTEQDVIALRAKLSNLTWVSNEIDRLGSMSITVDQAKAAVVENVTLRDRLFAVEVENGALRDQFSAAKSIAADAAARIADLLKVGGTPCCGRWRMTSEQRQKLRALAEEAATGWKVARGTHADAAFIEAAKPQTVLALLDEITRLESRWHEFAGPIEADRECLRADLAAMTAKFDDLNQHLQRVVDQRNQDWDALMIEIVKAIGNEEDREAAACGEMGEFDPWDALRRFAERHAEGVGK